MIRFEAYSISLLLISGRAGACTATTKIGLEDAVADAVADVLLE